MQVKSKKPAFERSASTKKNIRFEDELLDRINSVAGEGQFSSWVKQACIEKLERLEKTK
ncbi:DUF3950 domain-containing protein [Enterobacter ludwigii]|uniref:YlcI/YnfO family protein n=1 Tax=Enterobacter ludwigii TaxID=299767 RepID=UPI00242D954C|nr:YlcI/YnfO family protein [Enterobacter ludwigii]WGA06430.1 DUF3950 domain-containing protein [Enterobacter ludwigii]